jgi:hypothetical protein
LGGIDFSISQLPPKELKHTTNRYVRRVEKIFKNMLNHMEWLSFLNYNLPLAIDFCKVDQEAAMQNGLNGAQTPGLGKTQISIESGMSMAYSPR